MCKWKIQYLGFQVSYYNQHMEAEGKTPDDLLQRKVMRPSSH